MNKYARTTIAVIFILSACVLLTSNFIGSNEHNQSEIKEYKVVHRTYTTDTIIKNGKFETIYYPYIVNIKFGDDFFPITEFLNVSQEDGKLKISELNGKSCYISLDYNLKTQSDKGKEKSFFNVSKNKNYYYFTSNIDKDIKSMKYNLDCNDYKVSFKDDKLILDNLEIDFGQAKKDQNIKTMFDEDTKSLSFSANDNGKPVDFKVIDPKITYNESSVPNVIITCNSTTTDLAPLDDFGNGSDATSDSDFNADDGLYYTMSTDTGKYGWCRMSLNISSLIPSDITLLNFTTVTDSSSATLSLYHYIYDYVNSNWDYLQSWSQSTTDIIKSSSVSSDLLNYNSSTNYVDFLLQTNTSSTSDANIDYIFASVTYHGLLINTPTPNSEVLNTFSTILNTSQTAHNNTVWYTWNGGIKNNTLCTNSNECQATITFPRQGYYNLTVYGNKSDGTITSNSVSNLFVGNKSSFNNLTAGRKDKYYSSPNCYNSAELRPGGNYRAFIFYNITGINNKNMVNATEYIYARNAPSPVTQNIYRINSSWNETDCSLPTKDNLLSSINFPASSAWLMIDLLNLVKNIANNTYVEYGIEYTNSVSSSSYINSFENPTNPHYLNITFYSRNSQSIVTNTLSNNSNFSISNVNFTFNISDDNDYLNNISLILDNNINTTLINPAITANTNNSISINITGISDGYHNWSIRAYDSDGNITNSENYTFIVDTTPPSLSIIYPPNGASFTTGTIDLNYTVSDATIGLNTCWYRNNTDSNNITIACGTNATISQSNDGTYIVYMWANDSLGNIASTDVEWTVSADAPALSILYPINNKWFDYTNISFNFTAVDSNGIDTCELWGNWTGGWHKNLTIQLAGDTSINISEGFFNQNISDGNYIWNVWCNDSATPNKVSWGLINRTFHIDTIFPKVFIHNPINQTYNYSLIDLKFTSVDINGFSCWYNINNTNNITLTDCLNTTITMNQGDSFINVYSNDSSNNINYTTIYFYVDSLLPSVILNTSFANNSYLNYNTSIKFNLTIFEYDLDSCYYNNLTSDINFDCDSNLSIDLGEGFHTLRFSVNDTLNNLNNSNIISFTTDVTNPKLENTVVTTSEGSQTISIILNATDTNLNSCYYTIRNSTDGVDSATTENETITCTSGQLSYKSETVSKYASYNITLYTQDKSGNLNQSVLTFTTTESAPVIQTGGGGSPTIVLGNSNWSIFTETGTSKYTLKITKGYSRTKQLLFMNDASVSINVTLSCEGDLCPYVVLPNETINLPTAIDIPTQSFFTINLPENISEDNFLFNIRGIDQFSLSNVLTVEVQATSSMDLSNILSKVLMSKKIFNINIPYVLISSLIGITTYFICLFLIFFNFRAKVGFSFLIGFLGFLLSLYFIP